MSRIAIFLFCLPLLVGATARGALISSVELDYGNADDGRKRYEYTLTNDSASEFTLDTFLLDTGSFVHLEILAAEGWLVDFAPDEGTYELAFQAGPGAELAPGESAVFTLLTAATPQSRPYFLANIEHSFEEGGYVFDFIMSPVDPYALRPGDTNDDGLVDLTDLNNVRNNFGQRGDPVLGDTDPFNGLVDLYDLNQVRNNFGTDYNHPATAPEPTAWLLAMVGGLIAAVATRRAR